jgi:flagellar biosynthetic protein FlhB
MAEDVDPESKTEDPSPRRREEARKQGQIPFSTELVGAAVLLAAVVGLIYFGGDIGRTMLDIVRTDLKRVPHADLTPLGAQELVVRVTLRALLAMAPLFGVLLAAGVAASAAQVGLQFSPEKFEPKPDKLNPVTGAKRLFSVAALVKGGLGLLKVVAIGGVAYWVLEGRSGVILTLDRDSVAGATAASWNLVLRLGLYLVGAMALIAAIDYLYQRRRFENSLKMTKQEVKDELKQEEGDPQLKARIRQIARERMKRKMLREVPKATVVITNPTHYAVALRYTAGDPAPVLVAKGAGVLAERIRDLARKNGIPLVERPVLARGIYATVKEGQPIPTVLFRAVAEVLAFIFRLRGNGPGAGVSPQLRMSAGDEGAG